MTALEKKDFQNGNASSLSDMIEVRLQAYFQSLDGQLPSTDLHKTIMAQVEKPLLKVVLEHLGGNKLKASEALGLSRNTLSKKLKCYELT